MRSLLVLWRRHRVTNLAVVAMTAIAVVLGTLGLAVFDALHWRALPFLGAADVLVISSRHESPRETRAQVNWSFARAQYVSERATSVELVGPWRPASVTLTGPKLPVVIRGEFVSRGYFQLLHARPSRGREFSVEELVPGSPHAVAIVSEHFRQRRQDLDTPLDVGSVLDLNGHRVSVIGIMPQGFRGLTANADVWLPIPLAPVLTYPEFLTTNQDFITLLARRKPHVPQDDVDREVARLAAAAYQTIPTEDVGADVIVSGAALPLGDARVRPEGRRAAGLVLGGSLTLLLLALANLTALHMSRTIALRRQSAVALAMGASVTTLWRSLMREGALVLSVGGLVALGVLTAWLNVVGTLDPLATLGRSAFGTFTALTMDARLIGWWALTSATAVVAAAALPAAWAARRVSLADLQAGSRGSAATGLSLRRPGTPAIILGVEAALAVVLVVTAAQLIDSYRRMQGADIGVVADRVLTFEVQPPESVVPPSAAPAFIDRVLDAVRQVPGVQSASVDGGAPLVGSASTRLHVIGQPGDPVAGAPLVLRHYVGTEHFATLGIPLRAGRAFTDADRAGAAGAVIISESAARQYFPEGDALGRRVWFDGSTMTSPATAGGIVGIVGDVKYDPLLSERTAASFYTPYRQFTYGARVYFVKVAGDPSTVTQAIVAAVGRVAPDLPVLNARSLADIVTASSRVARRAAHGTGVLAVLGLLLAASGIWAVVSHATGQRTREVAIRIAHGATTGGIVRLVLGDGLVWPMAGLVLGALISVATSGALQSLLYAVTPGDPALVIAGMGVFIGVAVAACVAPAVRAAQIDPIAVLRSDS